MKKVLFISLLFLAPAAVSAQNKRYQAIINKIENAKKQYREAFDNVKIDSRIYASCLENQYCSYTQLKEHSQTIKTNLGIMAASLSTMTLGTLEKEKFPPNAP